ncbi:hypothetical protein [Sphingomonas crusticola]|uniref:hypothetical protein n=1 Tax=Sphingomonas crusticola TaxID=1697973 RepID=UPI0013C30069|nr:hypothetical protein [Sphingomonas crusticola]
MKRIILGFALALTIAAPAIAQIVDPLQSEELIKKVINEPGTAWTFYGSGVTSKVIKDPDIPGGEAVRVTISQKGANPWDAGALYQVLKPIKTGDVIYFAVYLRAPELKSGETTAMPTMGVTQQDSPYAPIAVSDARIGNQWGVYYAAAKAITGYPRGKARVSVQLASKKQVIDLGPVFVLNLGPNYDIGTLPHN